MLRLKRSVLEAVISHARQEMPYEACGYLAQKNGVVGSMIAMTNIDRDAEHFSMDPAEQFAAVKAMRAKGEDLCGVYHSHPATPARPSAEDIRLAFDPDISYVIVSFANRHSVQVKSFRIRQGVVIDEEIEIVGDSKSDG